MDDVRADILRPPNAQHQPQGTQIKSLRVLQEQKLHSKGGTLAYMFILSSFDG